MIDRKPGEAILSLEHVAMTFSTPSREPLPIFTDISLVLHDGEILGLLGRSGAGKSTILRIAAGLMKPTSGSVEYRGHALTGPEEGIAMVFQTFALFPWLTVLQNVQTGLDALGVPQDDGRARATAAIRLIGLEGFESAYPRELSGGMRQRVGFARALVVDPHVMLMDEPFSALDVLTAEKLRTDVIDLWITGKLPIRSMLMVTHNIEEAVFMCDRILVLSSKPARIEAEIAVTLEHPRNRLDAKFHGIVDQIYALLTSTETVKGYGPTRGLLLPPVSAFQIVGLIDRLAASPFDGRADLSALQQMPGAGLDRLLPAVDALTLLEFAQAENGTVTLTAAGRCLADLPPEERPRIFKEHLERFVPLAGHIWEVLADRASNRAPRVRFESELEDTLTQHDALATLETVTGWARYARLFDYDGRTRTFFTAGRSGITP